MDTARTGCPACSTPVEDVHRFCPACGTALDDEDAPTGTAPRGVRSSSSHAHASHGAGNADRFPPGTVLGGRYRIVGLLGRGGMGEVYRADDLKLEQPVALKFLPRALEGDSERLGRLYAEVRIARQVSHPAVCRVWDVGEAEGQHFLAMEFVDGENLASLLRRIGRLSGDKALDIARQVAAGLAAAHDKGVLHRDVKPANVMLDSQGKVRLTDFGLAGLAADLRSDIRSGTPSYMSPEQLEGREVTARSDVYAFGLLLYELFTGHRAFEGRSFAELARKHRDERPIEPSAIVPDLDPVVDRTIMACLEKQARKRPPSAFAVLAMLQGRDPLEAAVAAGETPSPELVAAAGESERMRTGVAATCLALVLAALLAIPWIRMHTHLLALIPPGKTPAALEDRARELIARLGAGVAADAESGLMIDGDYFRWTQQRDASPRRWESLRTGDPPVVQFWYRQSPRPLNARASFGAVSWHEPPIDVSGMSGVRYDVEGRLVAFLSVPPQVESEARDADPRPDWGPLLAEARLDPARLRAVPVSRTPPFFSDARAAWTGTWPGRADIPIRIEAAAYRGRPVWFEIVEPWSRPEREEPWTPTRGQRLAHTLGISLILVLTATGAILARRNTRLGRGDRRGAARLGLAVFGVMFVSWTLSAHHVASPVAEVQLAARGAGLASLGAAFVWLFYLALEPYVRRLRPWTLVSWTRALSGGVEDAIVGRDVLFGMAWGATISVVMLLGDLAPAWMGHGAAIPDGGFLDVLLGSRLLLAFLVGGAFDATLLGLGALLLFLLLRLLTRSDTVAAVLVVALLAANNAGQAGEPLWWNALAGLVFFGSYVLLLLHRGVLAAIFGALTVRTLLSPPLTWALDGWAGAATPPVLIAVAALAAFAFRCAVRSRRPVSRFAGAEPSSSRSS